MRDGARPLRWLGRLGATALTRRLAALAPSSLSAGPRAAVLRLRRSVQLTPPARRRLRLAPLWAGAAAVPVGVVVLAMSLNRVPSSGAVQPLVHGASERPTAGIEAAAPAVALPPATVTPAPAPPAVTATPTLRPHEIFGFAPYWTLPMAGGFDLRSLSTVAYFGVDVAPDGSLIGSGEGWAGYQSQDLAQLISAAHFAGDRVVLTAKSFDQATLDRLSSDPTAADRLGSQLVQAIQAKAMDGANLDFEGLGGADRAGMARFIAAVSGRLHAANPHWQVTVDTYTNSASNPNGFFDVPALARVTDGLFVMAYDMYSSGAASPNSPLNSYSANVAQSMAWYRWAATPSKVILGLPFYGYDWPTANNAPNASAAGNPAPVGYGRIRAAGLPTYWDAKGSVPWTAYQVGGQWHEAYYDNPQSLAMKAYLADADGLGGVGIWALGMDGNDPAMMAALLGKARPLKLPTGPSTLSSSNPPPGGAPPPGAAPGPPPPGQSPPPQSPPPSSPPPSSPPPSGGGSPPPGSSPSTIPRVTVP
jgi:spore germination protein YaaH